MSAAYTHQPLEQPDRQIRLVKLHQSAGDSHHAPVVQCSLATTHLAGAPEYVALSYACGDPYDLVPVEIEGRQLMVYRNLDAALRRIRPKNLGLLWIDCLSIDQSDATEKSVQVGLMSQIFKHAKYVLAWLGEATASSSAAFDILQAMGKMDGQSLQQELTGYRKHPLPLKVTQVRKRFCYLRRKILEGLCYQNHTVLPLGDLKISRHSRPTLLDIIGESGMRAIIELLLRPWFYRLWIRQELFLARQSKFMCGADVCQGLHMILGICASFTFLSFMQRGASSFLQRELSLADHNKLTDVWSLCLRALSPGLHSRSLSDLVRENQRCQCELGQDKIFALLGIAKDDGLVALNAPDYSMSVMEVYERFICTSIQLSDSVDVLGYNWHEPTGSSWISDLRSPVTMSYLSPYGEPQFYRTSLDRKAQCEFPVRDSTAPRVPRILKVQGFQLDQIEQVGLYAEAGFAESPESPSYSSGNL